MIRDTFVPLLFFVDNTKGIKQSEIYHPEGDVLNHLLQVFEWAIRESDDIDLIIAALLHDTGKAIRKIGHAEIIIELLKQYTSGKTLWLIENHMRIWYYILGDMKKHSKCIELGNHPWLPELIQLARWDKLGRNPNKKIIYDKEKIIKILIEKSSLHFNDRKET